MTLEIAVLPLIGGPLAGAVLLALAGTRASRRVREGITGVALVVAVAGLAWAALDWTTTAHGGAVGIGLGPLDPSDHAAGIGWSLAPAALGILFVAIAARAGSRLVVGLAAVQLAVATLGAGLEIFEARGSTETSEAAHTGLLVDPLALTLLAVSVLIGGLIVVYALGYEPAHLGHRGLPTGRSAAFVAWLLLFIAAMNVLVAADDLRLLVVGWEVTTLCSFVLIGFDGDDDARVAARRALAYNLVGGIGLGAAVLLAGPGATLSDVVGGSRPAGSLVPIVLAGCILAAATKSALVPFHPWLLGAMVAAAPVSALLHASAMVKAGSYLLLRLAPPIAADGLLGPVLAVLGGLTFAATAVEALRQRDLKRILAYSTISTLGLIAAAAALGSAAALAAGVLLLVFHAVAKALAFLSVGAIEQVGRTRDLEALVGSLRTVPRLAGPLVIAAAALALPPFGLAVAKWALLELGARDLPLIVLLTVGGAAYLVVWTALVGRLLVRRPGITVSASDAAALPARERAPIVMLAFTSAAGLVLAGPVARLVADPAGRAAFGVDPGLAAGWSIALAGGTFLVPVVATLVLAAAVLGVVVARRIRTVAPSPYLSGAGMAGAGPSAFHGGLGRPIEARSGGFYWGGGDRARATAVAGSGQPVADLGAARDPVGRGMEIAGWVMVVIVGLAAAAGAIDAGVLP